MKTCEEILDLISLRLDGELTPEQEQALAEHLASCPACKALADDLADIHSVMPGMNVEPPASIMENVMGRIRGEEASVIPFPVKKNSRPQWKAWAGVAAALVLVAGGAIALWGGNASKGDTPMTLDVGMPEASAAPSAYRAAIEGAEDGELMISLPTPEPSAVPSCAPEGAETPADEPISQDRVFTGGNGASAKSEQSNTTATPGTESPQIRTFAMPPPQPSASAAPSSTPSPTPDNRQMMTGLAIDPSASPVPVSHLTVAGAAMKLYEEKYAERFPNLEFSELEDFVGYVSPDWSLKYIGQTEDGTAYEFEEAYFEGETKAVQARYLVPADGSEIQTIALETEQ